MNYSYWLSKADNGCGDNPRNGGDTSSQGSLRLELKRSREQLAGDHAPRPEAVARTSRLVTDDFTTRSFPAGPHMTSMSPWAGTPSSLFAPEGQFDHHLGGQPNSLKTMSPVAGAEYPRNQSFVGYNSELGGASELPILNHTAGFPSFSRSIRFAGIDSSTVNSQHFNRSDANRRLDGIFSCNGMSSMYPSHGAYNNLKEACMGSGHSSQLLSDYGSYLRNEANISDKGVENMRRVLGKEPLMIDRSPSDGIFPKESSKFTLMGEQVERNTGTLSSTRLDYKQHHEKMAALAPQGYLFASGSHRFYAADNSALPTWDDANLTSSSADACKKGYLSFRSFGSDNVMPPAAGFTGSNQKGSGTTLPPSFEVSNASVMQQEAMCNTWKNPAEHAITGLRAASKSVTLKRKDRNKHDANVFPNNVKSLLSTGIFDGVPVKYVSWDRTKNVRGTIQGTGYVCWCKDCDKKKIVNAYQLEQHAGSKSKHPNDHIYFSNGKSVYGVVQELKNTPSDKLLEVIPTITGCGINEANLSKWKGSFKAARRELRRIFGSDPEEEKEEEEEEEAPSC